MKHLFLVEEIQTLKKHAGIRLAAGCLTVGGVSTQETELNQARVGRTALRLACV